jgi:hypothetical protein
MFIILLLGYLISPFQDIGLAGRCLYYVYSSEVLAINSSLWATIQPTYQPMKILPDA